MAIFTESTCMNWFNESVQDDQEMYQNIFNEIKNTLLPNWWSKIVFNAKYIGNSYEMIYYIDTPDELNIPCFEFDNFNNVDFDGLFARIDKIISKSRNKLSGKYKWTSITLNIDRYGNFKANYGY